MDKDTLQEIAKLYEKINSVDKKLDAFINTRSAHLQADIDYVAIMTDTYVDEEGEEE